MKKLFLILLAATLLSACTAADPNVSGSSDETGKPKIPNVSKGPKIPQANLQANLLGATRQNLEDQKRNDVDMEGLVKRIDEQIEKTNVTTKDIDRGWYYASKEDRKWGTPRSWVWVDDGDDSHWISPESLLVARDVETDKLCRDSGGHFVISCLDRDLPHCEHIPKSECSCSLQSRWHEGQGCILVNGENEYQAITSEELSQGWYFGLKTQKKLNTPGHWIWFEKGLRSRWQNTGA